MILVTWPTLVESSCYLSLITWTHGLNVTFQIIYHSDWITKFVKTIKLKHGHRGLKDGTKLLLVLAHPSPIPSPHVQLF
jgi:hypothetical protein